MEQISILYRHRINMTNTNVSGIRDLKEKTKKKRYITFCVIISLLVLLTVIALRTNISIVTYHIKSPKIEENITIALVADLHSCDFGTGQAEIVSAIKNAAPDMVLLGGDIVDDRLPRQKAMEFLSAISNEYPCYYVSGNHEFWSGEIDDIKDEISAMGITVLEGERADISINGQSVSLYGIDDPEIGESEFSRQLENCGKQTDDGTYSVLLTHRPERIESYLNYGFDLMLAGHAHGGQVRLPLLINGLFAPEQGWFPKYAGGLYQLEDSKMIVSRGLSKESSRVPRVFNPPELVMITLSPSDMIDVNG